MCAGVSAKALAATTRDENAPDPKYLYFLQRLLNIVLELLDCRDLPNMELHVRTLGFGPSAAESPADRRAKDLSNFMLAKEIVIPITTSGSFIYGCRSDLHHWAPDSEAGVIRVCSRILTMLYATMGFGI